MAKSKKIISHWRAQVWGASLLVVVAISMTLLASYFFFQKVNNSHETAYLKELSDLGEKLREKQNQNDELHDQLVQLDHQMIKPGQAMSYCLGKNEISVLANLDTNKAAGSTLLSKFFNNPEIKELEKKGSLHQLCNPNSMYNSLLSFVLYGDYGEFNNIIGTFTADNKVITDKKFNSGGGDIGVCQITGSIGNGIGYVCGGGDGPGGHYSIYLLNAATAKSTLIKKCTSFEGAKDKCDIDLFKII